MNDAIATQGKFSGSSTLLHTLALAFAALTLVFALLSLILGNRLVTLQTNFLTVEKETVTSETASIKDMETSLKTAMDKLETAQKSLKEEKAATDRVSRQLAGIVKDFEKAKADLSSANQTIAKLKSTVPTQPPPTDATPEPDTKPEQNQSSTALPAPVQIPAATAPEPSATQAPSLPAGATEIKADTPTTLPNASPTGD